MLSMFNGLQIDVPEGWADVSTIVVAPKSALLDGKKPTINLLVKRRPCASDDSERSMNTYLKFMTESFGALGNLATKEMVAGAIKGRSIAFSAVVDGTAFRQYTFLYFVSLPGGGGEEVSATVTQLEGDATPLFEIEKLLKSVRRAAAVRGGR